jgi:hypothetical protein
VQQLEAVAKRYLQHCFDDMGRDLKVPNNGEGEELSVWCAESSGGAPAGQTLF